MLLVDNNHSTLYAQIKNLGIRNFEGVMNWMPLRSLSNSTTAQDLDQDQNKILILLKPIWWIND